MKTKAFFANVVSKFLALATIVMISIAFTACSKDSKNDDDNGGGGGEQPKPTYAGYVTFGNEQKPIQKAEYKFWGNNDYTIYLYLSDNNKERVEIYLNTERHMKGNPIKLTEKEDVKEGFWAIAYYNSDNKELINAYGSPSDPVLFEDGTLTVEGDFKNIINIKLEKGRIASGEGSEPYTLILNYKGGMKQK